MSPSTKSNRREGFGWKVLRLREGPEPHRNRRWLRRQMRISSSINTGATEVYKVSQPLMTLWPTCARPGPGEPPGKTCRLFSSYAPMATSTTQMTVKTKLIAIPIVSHSLHGIGQRTMYSLLSAFDSPERESKETDRERRKELDSHRDGYCSEETRGRKSTEWA